MVSIWLLYYYFLGYTLKKNGSKKGISLPYEQPFVQVVPMDVIGSSWNHANN